MSCSCSANSDEGAWRSKTMMLSGFFFFVFIPHYINIVRLVFQIEDRVKQVIHSFYVETLR